MMSNSPLVQYTKISPNSSNPRNNKIKNNRQRKEEKICVE